jgi:hypothetical protein
MIKELEMASMPLKSGMPLYDLQHFKIHPDGTDEVDNRKGCGTFTSRRLAHAAAARLILNEGYRDWPDGFRLFEMKLDEDRWPRGFDGPDIQDLTPDRGEPVIPRAMPPGERGPRQWRGGLKDAITVYPLLHFPIPAGSTDEYEDPAWKLVGVYSTPEKQQAARDRARWLPGFRQWPFGFRLWRDELDHCDLESGFISWDEA